MFSFLFQLCQHHDVLLFFSGVDVAIGHATFKVNLELTELEAKTELLWELTNNVKPCRASRLRDFVSLWHEQIATMGWSDDFLEPSRTR